MNLVHAGSSPVPGTKGVANILVLQPLFNLNELDTKLNTSYYH